MFVIFVLPMVSECSVMTYMTFVRTIVLVETSVASNVTYNSCSHIMFTASEFERLLSKHATSTGLPVVVDFYSDGCGPCRMMAPVFKKLAASVKDKAVFCKVDTNTMYELSSRYQIRSLPTFVFFLDGKVWNQFSGAGEQQLHQMTNDVIRQAELQNVVLSSEDLVSYYQAVDPTKDVEMVQGVYKKCVEMKKGADGCVGAAASQLARRLKKKYGSAPQLKKRFAAEEETAKGGEKQHCV